MERLDVPIKIWDFNEDSRFQGKFFRDPCDIAFLGNDVVVVADSEKHSVELINFRRGTSGVLGNKRTQLWPNGVATTREGHIVVADRKEQLIKVFDPWGDLLVRMTPEMDPDERFYPYGVASNSKGEIIFTDTAKHRVCVFSPQGKKNREFGHPGRLLQEMCLPFYCCVDSADNIYVSDNMNFAIKKFDKQGNFMFHLGSGQDWGKRKIRCPYGIVCDQEDNIVSADNDPDTQSVRIFDPTGDYFTYVVCNGNEPAKHPVDSCVSPVGVAVSKDGKVAFTESSKDHANIKIYQCCA